MEGKMGQILKGIKNKYRKILWIISEGVSRTKLKRYEKLIKAKSTVLTFFKMKKIGLTTFLKI